MNALINSPKSTALSAIVCLCLVVVVLFWPVFFQGKVIVPGDIPASNPFLFKRNNTPPPPPQNTLLSDEIEQFYIWHSIAAKSLQADGHIPLWNPYIFTGQPLVANAQSSLFYPPNLLLRILSAGKVATIRIIFNLLFAGIFTFYFCRELRISDKGAFLSAISFAFSGPMIVWIGFPLANVLVCLPFLMWAGEKLLQHKNLFRTAMLGAGMGLSLLGGHPETTFQVLAVFSVYFLSRLVFLGSGYRDKAGYLGSFLLAVIIGAILSGIQLLPFLDFMMQSSTFARGGRASDVGGTLFYSQEWLSNLTTAVTLICPNFFGNPLDHSYIWPFKSFQNYNEQSIFFGLTPLALAVGAIFADSKSRPLLIISALAVFCIVVAWHLPGFEAISHLPVFSMAPSKRLRLPFVFLTAVMAGYGYDIFLERLKSGNSTKKGFYASVSIILVTILLFIWIIILKGPVAYAILPGTFGDKILHSVFAFRQWRTYLPLVIAITLVIGYLLSLRSQRISRCFPNALLALTAFELCALGWGYNPMVKESEILPAVPAVEFLQKREQQPYRILTTDGYFYPNYGATYGIADVAGYDAPVYQCFSDLYLAQGGRSIGGQIDSRQQWDPNWALVDFLNVRYVISPRDLSPDKYKMLFENKYFAIYENLHAMPRAFMVYDSEVISDRKTVLDKMLNNRVDLSRKVLLDEPLQNPVTATLGPPAVFSVEHVKYATDEVVLRVTSDKPGILVMSDLYTPDWRVRIDDREVKLYRANYAFRAVSVPQGGHIVTFRYAPLTYIIGVAMTICGMVVLLVCCGFEIRRQARI